MMRKFTMYNLQCTIKLILLLFTFYILHSTFYITPVYACHQPGQPIPAGQPAHQPNQPARLEDGPCPAGLTQIEQTFSRGISVAVGLGFMVLLVMITWAGFKYLMSGGEPKAVQAAHQTVTWALLGIVFMALAWLILKLIFAFTGINVTFFDIRTLCSVVGADCK